MQSEFIDQAIEEIMESGFFEPQHPPSEQQEEPEEPKEQQPEKSEEHPEQPEKHQPEEQPEEPEKHQPEEAMIEFMDLSPPRRGDELSRSWPPATPSTLPKKYHL